VIANCNRPGEAAARNPTQHLAEDNRQQQQNVGGDSEHDNSRIRNSSNETPSWMPGAAVFFTFGAEILRNSSLGPYSVIADARCWPQLNFTDAEKLLLTSLDLARDLARLNGDSEA
jgi:hypothetical protein